MLAKDDLALVRIVGPGICRESGRFENVLVELERRGYPTVVVDLAECPRIDSTFAGAFLRLADRAGAGRRVLLAGAHGAVAELLDTLLLGDALPTVELPEVEGDALRKVEVPDRDLTREEIMSLSLDGHQRLAGLGEANALRFATLLEVLRAQVPGRSPGSESPAAPASNPNPRSSSTPEVAPGP